MVLDNAKWDKLYRIFYALPLERRNMAAALYHGTMKLHRDAHSEPCSEEIMETCLRTLGHLPELYIADGALEYDDAMAGNEIVANLTSERKI